MTGRHPGAGLSRRALGGRTADTVAYKDRGAVLDPKYTKQANSGNGIIYPTIVVDGRVVGTWKRTLKKDALVITP
ncbi:MAG: DNA glycosylase AlkZ-like family protein, partial [Blastocatellia bacterium]